MKCRVILLLSMTGAAALDAAAADVVLQGAVQVTASDGPGRFAAFELIVPASLDEVWRVLSTSDGLAEWAGPAAFVDLRRDGQWDVYFKPDAPPGQRGSENRLIGFVPERLLLIEAGAPPQFPTVKAEKTLAIFEIEPLNATHTRVRMTQTGWKNGAEWDAAFSYLLDANATWLGWLHARFAEDPERRSESPETDSPTEP